MKKYLLLRDNKQTGPYSLEEIRELGLKNYDLIWVEGKSAAWRYPGEVEEMKSFAPAVEEQPFDRFFRKPVHEEHYQLQKLQTAESTKLPSDREEIKKPAAESKTEKNEGERKIPTRKYVSVSLPRSPHHKTEPVKNIYPVKTQEALVKKDATDSQVKLEPIFPAPADNPVKVKPALDASVNQSPIDSRRVPVKSSFNSQDLIQYGALAMGIISILLIGFLVFNSETADPQIRPVQKSPVQNRVTATVQDEPEIRTIPAVNNLPPDQPASKKSVLKPADPVQKKAPETVAKNEIVSPVVEVPVTTPATNETATKPVSLEKLVSATMEDYRVNLFGGIDEVKVKLTNNSTYKLDMVVVELQYVLANKKIFRTETVRFKNIEPGESATLDGPDSARGIKVNSKVTYITSTQAGVSENF